MSDRPVPDIRAELELLAERRRVLLGADRINPEKGLPLHVAPPSGVGGDIVENRAEEGR